MGDVKPPLSLVSETLSDLRAYRVPTTPPPIKLDANEGWPVDDALASAIWAEVRDVALHRYPDGRATQVTTALASAYGGAPDDYVVGVGSDELIALLVSALCRPRANRRKPTVVFPTPTFVMYGVTGRGHGWEPVPVPLNDAWHLDINAMQQAFDTHTPNLAFYASPNNPTGNHFADEALVTLIEANTETLHVIDEAYAPFSEVSRYDWCDRYPNVAVMGTLSKIGFAAARVGWIRMHESIAAEVDKVRQPFNVNALSQAVAAQVLGPLSDSVAQTCAKVVAERTRLVAALSNLLPVHPTGANFVLTDLGERADRVDAILAKRQIAIRRFTAPRLQTHARITVGTPSQNDALIDALGEGLQPS